MEKTYLYEMPPTDYFFMFKTLDETVESVSKNEDFGEEVDGITKILNRVVANAKNCFRKYTHWEGDGTVYILGLPDGDSDVFPNLLVLIKQCNNGTTFLFSPVELPHLKKYLIDINR